MRPIPKLLYKPVWRLAQGLGFLGHLTAMPSNHIKDPSQFLLTWPFVFKGSYHVA